MLLFRMLKDHPGRRKGLAQLPPLLAAAPLRESLVAVVVPQAANQSVVLAARYQLNVRNPVSALIAAILLTFLRRLG